jgi:hypothetical protein
MGTPLTAAEARQAKEESPYHFMLIKIKKGEKKCYVSHLLNDINTEYVGPFGVDLTIQNLIEHKEGIARGKGEASSSPSSSERFPKAVKEGRIPNVGLKELMESERKSKKRKEMSLEIQTP